MRWWRGRYSFYFFISGWGLLRGQLFNDFSRLALSVCVYFMALNFSGTILRPSRIDLFSMARACTYRYLFIFTNDVVRLFGLLVSPCPKVYCDLVILLLNNFD